MGIQRPNRRQAEPNGTWRRFLPQTLAILLLLGGIAGYLGGTNAVRLVDDGSVRTVRTYANTVKGLLHHAGVTLNPHDVVTPAPADMIRAGVTVVVSRGRPVILTLDGRAETRWVTSRTVVELLTLLKLDTAKVRIPVALETAIPRDGMRLTVRTEKRLLLLHDGERQRLTTYAATPAELFEERGIRLEGRDEVKPAPHDSLAGVRYVRLIRVTVKPKREIVRLDPPVKVRKNPDWMLDQRAVIDRGKAGRADQRIEYVYRDGRFSERKVISSKTLVEPEPAVVRKGTRQYPPDDTGLNWAALAECESGGNPRVVSENGMYHGLYQFNVDMWHRMGGIGLPSDATSREQTYRAIRLYKAAGADQWPHCGPRLFT
ncbi:MAG TPA: ubiquitin-like domain-containing protein [Micromonosporaceae bacterium]|nr:ubiquitin-like domain-containing protein [Micromonosporaceae bacterium]